MLPFVTVLVLFYVCCPNNFGLVNSTISYALDGAPQGMQGPYNIRDIQIIGYTFLLLRITDF